MEDGSWCGRGGEANTGSRGARTNRRTLILVSSLVVALLASASSAVQSDEAARAARQLLDQVGRLNDTMRAWKDRTQQLELSIVDRRKNERRREMKVLTKKFAADDTRTILFILAPVEVRGVGLLQWSLPDSADTQWLYLPEIKQPPRQISGNSKRDSFVGTDFSFEDLTIWSDILDWSEQDARAVLLKDEPLQGQDCAVIEMVPSGVEVSYDRIRLWLGRQDSVIHRMEFDDRGKTVKTLELTDVRPVRDIPVAHRLEMRNMRTGSSTVVVFTSVEFDTGLGDDEFTQRRLHKGM